MDYISAKLKRVLVLRFNHKGDILKEFYKMAKKEKIKSGLLFLVGAIKDCKVVTGPKKPVIPPKPNWTSIVNAHEVIGVGTLFPEKGNPKLHLHLGLGRGKKTYVGCLRSESDTYLVVEGVFIELSTGAVREYDNKSKLALLKL